MSKTRSIAKSHDPLSERIEAAIVARRLEVTAVRDLVGMSEWTWRRRRHLGDWKPRELAAIADVLQMRVTTLIGDVA